MINKGIYINSKYINPTKTYALHNPHTEQLIAHIADSTEEEMLLAINFLAC